jgi:two-component SAPR family response regulator
VTLYISSQSALNFIKDHADDVDFVFVAVSMEEMSGFQFLDIARKMHRNIQVICKCKVFIERIFWFFFISMHRSIYFT